MQPWFDWTPQQRVEFFKKAQEKACKDPEEISSETYPVCYITPQHLNVIPDNKNFRDTFHNHEGKTTGVQLSEWMDPKDEMNLKLKIEQLTVESPCGRGEMALICKDAYKRWVKYRIAGYFHKDGRIAFIKVVIIPQMHSKAYVTNTAEICDQPKKKPRPAKQTGLAKNDLEIKGIDRFDKKRSGSKVHKRTLTAFILRSALRLAIGSGIFVSGWVASAKWSREAKIQQEAIDGFMQQNNILQNALDANDYSQ